MGAAGIEYATGRRHRLGQSVVEMALILPLFLLLALGILDFGRAFYDYERIQNAAREGAMWLGIHPTASLTSVTERVQNEGIVCGGGQGVQVTEAVLLTSADTVTTVAAEASDARVSVSCRFDLVSGWMATALSAPQGQLTLTGRAEMPVTQ